MEKAEVEKLVKRFLEGDQLPLEKAMRNGQVKPSVIVGILEDLDKVEKGARIEKEDDLEALGREIAKAAMKGEEVPVEKSEEELEALGEDIAKCANGEE
jgi:hypothetical protein